MEREERGRMVIVVLVVVVGEWGGEEEDNWMVESDGAAARRDGCDVAAALLWQAAVKVLKRCSMIVVLW